VRVEELDIDKVEEWTDGSRMEGRAAAATRTRAEYLGMMATVADAEELGVSMAWEDHDVVALDSKGVIQSNLYIKCSRPPARNSDSREARAPREPTRFVGGPVHPGDCGIAGPPASMAKTSRTRDMAKTYRSKRIRMPLQSK